MAVLRRLFSSSALLWGMVIVAGACFVYLGAPGWFEEKPETRSQEFLAKIAADINRSVPIMIDQETELMPAVASPGMLIYNYRLVSYSVTQVDHVRFAAGAKERVKQTACGRPETRDSLLKKGVTLRYSYFDKDKQHIATIDVAPSDCGF
ncbi:MAG TPA: hypothetical protein VJ864_08685 [Candidatus Binatia bacterium]|jgi:hypothetical protein|nr:hypothetical protein [Candidatus Binatia bacterium]